MFSDKDLENLPQSIEPELRKLRKHGSCVYTISGKVYGCKKWLRMLLRDHHEQAIGAKTNNQKTMRGIENKELAINLYMEY